MLENIELPEELLINIGSESKDFSIRSKLRRPVSRSVGRIFGLVWLGFISVFIWVFLGSVIQGGSQDVIINGENTTISPDNLKPATFLIIFFGVFVAIGLYMIIPGIAGMLQKGGYFVGTPARLVRYQKKVINSYDWSQFSGNIELRGTNERGSLTIELKTGTMVSSKSGRRYVPDIVYMIGISGAYDIEKIIRRRINENDENPHSNV
ncbi:MAG: hypothetical protein U0X39_01665 [Bacteroidales bacterium]